MEKTDVNDEVHKELKKLKLSKNKSDTKQIVDTVFDVLSHNLKTGRDISIVGFGKWEIRPFTFNDVKEPGTSKTRMVIRFKISRVIKEKLNEKLR